MSEAAGLADPTGCSRSEERFIAAVSHVEDMLAQLPAPVDGGTLKDVTLKLVAFGRSNDSIFDAAQR